MVTSSAPSGFKSRESILAVFCLLLFSSLSRATSSPTTIAIAQLRSTDVGNFSKMQSLATQAKEHGADLIVFPEESVFGWLNPDVFTKAAPIPGVYSDRFSAIARTARIWVAAGLAERGPKAGPGSMPNAYQAYDSGILLDPNGAIVIHHRQFNVVQNAFDPGACKAILNQDKCQYTAGSLQEIRAVPTPFGRTALLVCADAYTYSPAVALHALKPQHPDLLIVPWGITAAQASQCGGSGYDATEFASSAASFLGRPMVVGANSVGPRNYGRFLPSFYCGTSGYSDSAGHRTEPSPPDAELEFVQIPSSSSNESKSSEEPP